MASGRLVGNVLDPRTHPGGNGEGDQRQRSHDLAADPQQSRWLRARLQAGAASRRQRPKLMATAGRGGKRHNACANPRTTSMSTLTATTSITRRAKPDTWRNRAGPAGYAAGSDLGLTEHSHRV